MGLNQYLGNIYDYQNLGKLAYRRATDAIEEFELGRLNRALTVDRFLDAGSRRLLSFAL